MKIDVKIQKTVHNVICNCTVRLQIVNWLPTENKRPFEIMLNTALKCNFFISIPLQDLIDHTRRISTIRLNCSS